ncbi:cysteine hydrolase family protein [Gordonia sp. VNK21]|uniref:cysteine hydrolase family protein n=1 Tax=Gordonia sp. VNK21 TaxID=3382483 RepID=UPI0038D37294
MPDYLSPDYTRSALLMIDVQNDFVFGDGAIPGTEERLPAMAALLSEFRDTDLPIVHVVRAYKPGESDVDLVRRAAIEAGAQMVAPDSPGADIPEALLPNAVTLDWPLLRSGEAQHLTQNEVVLYKPRWSAFYRTKLDDLLHYWEVNTVVVAGCNLPNCPRATLFDASERDYRAVLVTDATSQVTPERLSDLELIGVNISATVSQLPIAVHRRPFPN